MRPSPVPVSAIPQDEDGPVHHKSHSITFNAEIHLCNMLRKARFILYYIFFTVFSAIEFWLLRIPTETSGCLENRKPCPINKQSERVLLVE